MVSFSEVFQGRRSARSEESIEDAFYKDINIAACGLFISEYDGELGIEDLYFREVKNMLVPPERVKTNGYGGRFYGHDGENWFFFEIKEDVLYDKTDLNSSDEDEGHSEYISASSGYMVKLDIQGETAKFLEVPVKYNMITNVSRSWGEHGTTSFCEEFPYFGTSRITDEDDVSILLEGLKELHWKKKFYFTTSFTDIMDIPLPLRRFFLRKNKQMWWNANKIAAAWTHSYWNPETVIGKKRLDRKYRE